MFDPPSWFSPNHTPQPAPARLVPATPLWTLWKADARIEAVFILRSVLVAMHVRVTLQRALRQLQTERARLDQQIAALSSAVAALGGGAVSRGATPRVARVSSRAATARPAMSAAQKKAVSKRMKAYWAKRRAAQAKK